MSHDKGRIMWEDHVCVSRRNCTYDDIDGDLAADMHWECLLRQLPAC